MSDVRAPIEVVLSTEYKNALLDMRFVVDHDHPFPHLVDKHCSDTLRGRKPFRNGLSALLHSHIIQS